MEGLKPREVKRALEDLGRALEQSWVLLSCYLTLAGEERREEKTFVRLGLLTKAKRLVADLHELLRDEPNMRVAIFTEHNIVQEQLSHPKEWTHTQPRLHPWHRHTRRHKMWQNCKRKCGHSSKSWLRSARTCHPRP